MTKKNVKLREFMQKALHALNEKFGEDSFDLSYRDEVITSNKFCCDMIDAYRMKNAVKVMIPKVRNDCYSIAIIKDYNIYSFDEYTEQEVIDIAIENYAKLVMACKMIAIDAEKLEIAFE